MFTGRLARNRKALLEALATGSRTGRELAQATGLSYGSVYTIARWLTAESLIASSWDERDEHGPVRRMWITPVGRRALERHQSV